MISREYVLGLLERYAQRYSAEKAVADSIITFVRSYPDCFERSLQVGHITGSAWLVNPAGSEVLLTHHAKLNAWFQLGGHSDGEPCTLEVARKEALEESGLAAVAAVSEELFDIDVHPIPATAREPQHYHYDLRFAFRAEGSTAFEVSDESHELAWVAIDAIGDYSQEESMLRMARKWRQCMSEGVLLGPK